jgi:hypothetical protein
MRQNAQKASKRHRLFWFLAASAFLAGAVLARPAQAEVRGDPFSTVGAGAKWHATGQTWPGVMQFDGKNHTMVLSPMGSPEI